jgi:hypothetical protein
LSSIYLHIIRNGGKGLLSIAFGLEGPELFPKGCGEKSLVIAYKILLCMTFSQSFSTKLICLSNEDSMPLLWALLAESSSSSYHLGLLPL